MATEEKDLKTLDAMIPMENITIPSEQIEQEKLRLDMVNLALAAERADAALKQMKASLKEYVDKHGPLYAGDKVWDYSTSVSWEFSDPALVKDMATAVIVDGKDAWNYLTFPAAAIKKLGWSESELLKYGKKKESRRFDSRKA